MFSNSLRLPFYHLVQDVLDYLSLAPSQLHPNALMILLSCCVVWRFVLGAEDDDYLDLTTREFFYTHRIRCHNGNFSSFCSCANYLVAHLEPRFFLVKDWFKIFFLVSGCGWEFPTGEAVCQEFPVRAVWGVVLNHKEFSLNLPNREQAL